MTRYHLNSKIIWDKIVKPFWWTVVLFFLNRIYFWCLHFCIISYVGNMWHKSLVLPKTIIENLQKVWVISVTCTYSFINCWRLMSDTQHECLVIQIWGIWHEIKFTNILRLIWSYCETLYFDFFGPQMFVNSDFLCVETRFCIIARHDSWTTWTNLSLLFPRRL